jgi:MoaA/NifB/PqqE/SkfB family radical SAM enzyme
VLSALNSDRIFELLEYIRTELKPDRSEVMYVRGEPRAPAAAQVSLDRFQEVHEWLKKNARPKNFLDRLREQLAMAKRELIIETVRENKMTLPCRAGTKLIVMEPDGWVRPCEMLSVKYPVPPPSLGAKDFRLGSLRESDYDLMKILGSDQAQKVNNFIRAGECRCSYECAALANLVFSPGQMPRIFWKAFR